MPQMKAVVIAVIIQQYVLSSTRFFIISLVLQFSFLSGGMRFSVPARGSDTASCQEVPPVLQAVRGNVGTSYRPHRCWNIWQHMAHIRNLFSTYSSRGSLSVCRPHHIPVLSGAGSIRFLPVSVSVSSISIISSRNDNSHSASVSGRWVMTQIAFTLVRLSSVRANPQSMAKFSREPDAHETTLLIVQPSAIAYWSLPVKFLPLP